MEATQAVQRSYAAGFVEPSSSVLVAEVRGESMPQKDGGGVVGTGTVGGCCTCGSDWGEWRGMAEGAAVVLAVWWLAGASVGWMVGPRTSKGDGAALDGYGGGSAAPEAKYGKSDRMANMNNLAEIARREYSISKHNSFTQ